MKNYIYRRRQEPDRMNAVATKIYRTLLKKIRNGTYPPESRLPFEKELAKTFKTNRMNAKRAVERLAEEGLAVRIRRKGSFVAADAVSELAGELLALKEKRVVFLYSGHPTNIHWNEATLRSFRACATSFGYHVHYETVPVDQGRAALTKMMCFLAKLRPSGLVMFLDNYEYLFMSANSDLFELFTCPVISLNRTGIPICIKDITTIDLDHYGDGVRAAELLLANQVSEIMFYYTESFKTLQWFQQRREGIVKTLSFAGIKVDLFEIGRHDPSRLKDFVLKNGPQSMIVAINNDHAEQAIKMLALSHLAAGTDYHLLAFDDYPPFHKYRLTSFGIDTKSLGILAARLVCLHRRNRELFKNCSIRVKSILFIRDSFRPAVLPESFQKRKESQI